ncbi:MAG: hypothetical protein P0Y53_06725 [Candidatus Pseudobacter hemicellulosilyticus]|uniref:Uncharacterized protein n=1 Tax=Candidatus Pseudobacter hemicellulosilyticus TaxID=3121375 RepID=A0AAJ6BIT0_9BACT|nr:MAG: hypothetical protein P0Y53_06725 [Pseudobacter sp.]
MYQLVPKKKKSIVLRIVIFLVACAVIKEGLTIIFSPAPVSQQLDKVASNINKRCPLVVDSMITLTNCVATSDYRLHYNYQLTTLYKEDVDTVSMIFSARENMINILKTDPNLAVFKKHDISVSASYYDKTGVYVCGVAVLPQELK